VVDYSANVDLNQEELLNEVDQLLCRQTNYRIVRFRLQLCFLPIDACLLIFQLSSVYLKLYFEIDLKEFHHDKQQDAYRLVHY
jgi:hypothetical protein